MLCLYVEDQTKQFQILENLYTAFDEIIITFTDQNGGLLEIEDKINLTLFIN